MTEEQKTYPYITDYSYQWLEGASPREALFIFESHEGDSVWYSGKVKLNLEEIGILADLLKDPRTFKIRTYLEAPSSRGKISISIMGSDPLWDPDVWVQVFVGEDRVVSSGFPFRYLKEARQLFLDALAENAAPSEGD